MKKTELTHGQKKALEAFRSGKNVFLTGEAGTGKSFVLNRFLESIPEDRKVLICAPTGIAAINIKGVTMHRVFKIPPRPLSPFDAPETIRDELLSAEVIIIDEISMCRFDIFQFAANAILTAERKSGIRKQLIVVGDFFQLPPVVTDKDRDILCSLWDTKDIGDAFAFQAPLWKAFDFVNVVLDEPVRQLGDPEFITHLNAIRKGDKTALGWFNDHTAEEEQRGISLCPTNREAAAINEREAEKLSGSFTRFTAICYGKVTSADKPTDDILRLKPGMQVMALINDRDELFQNGSLGIILSISAKSNSITVKFENGNVTTVVPYVWNVYEPELSEDGTLIMKVIGRYIQLPIRIAYAITIHKSQGQTFSSANLTPSCFAIGQLYVAISRMRNVSSLHLTKKIRPSHLKTSRQVVDFYRMEMAV